MTELPLQSAVHEVCWPAVPEPRGSAVLAVLFQLEQSQWWPAERLLERQMRQLGRLAAHARRRVPFYSGRLKGLRSGSDAGLHRDDWLRLPVLSRAEIQAAGDALSSASLPASHGQASEIYTSGSTGRPIRVVRSQLWELFWSAFTLRDHLWHRREMSGKLAVIRESGEGKDPYPDGSHAPNWGGSSGPLCDTGPSVGLNITCSIEQQADWLQRQEPNYLLTHPRIAHRLAEHCLAGGIRLPGLRKSRRSPKCSVRPPARSAGRPGTCHSSTCTPRGRRATSRCNVPTTSTITFSPKESSSRS